MRGSRSRSEIVRLPIGPIASRPVRSSTLLAAGLSLFAIVVALGPGPQWARAASALLLVACAGLASHARGKGQRPPQGWIVIDNRGLHRVGGGVRALLVEWGEPFGVTVLASADRANLLLALTTPGATRFIRARVRGPEDAASASALIERATTALTSELRGRDESTLSATDARRLLAHITRRVPAALNRVYLSDARAQQIVLDRSELRIAAHRIDLLAPLEWRTTIFQERGPHVASVCQATWVRQGDVEVVLVAPLSGDGEWTTNASQAVCAAGGGLAAKRAIARDLRLVQAVAGEPPPREMRHAIDRIFVLPLRRALERAPRGSRVVRPSRTMPEGRA